VVAAVVADRNAPALGGILNQQGVGNSTLMVELLGDAHESVSELYHFCCFT
jgi:hypothetical protein